MTWLAVDILAINLAVIVAGLAAGRAGIWYTDRRMRAAGRHPGPADPRQARRGRAVPAVRQGASMREVRQAD